MIQDLACLECVEFLEKCDSDSKASEGGGKVLYYEIHNFLAPANCDKLIRAGGKVDVLQTYVYDRLIQTILRSRRVREDSRGPRKRVSECGGVCVIAWFGTGGCHAAWWVGCGGCGAFH
jgi:hypothetical protein